MNRLEKKLSELKKTGRKAFVAYLTAGYPTASETVKLARLFEKSGADILELGIPFSDPIADGKTVQFASHTALTRGMTLIKALAIVKEIRKSSNIPVVLMGYLNPFLRHGLEKILKQAAASGVDGLIIPDIIPEESAQIRKDCRQNGLSLIYLAAPNTPDERLKEIDRASGGFVYIVSIAGVTGARKDLPATTIEYLKQTGKMIKRNPRIIGFGISSPRQVVKLKQYVDGIIVASALIEIIRNGKGMKTVYGKLERFVSSLRRALDR